MENGMSRTNQNSAQLSRRLSPKDVKALLADRAELAVIDVRETGVYSRDGHLLRSLTLPLSRLELEIASSVPLLNTPIVLVDDGQEILTARAAEKLGQLGYEDISILAGGTAGWKAAGFELFTGVHVIGIAFGEFAEHTYGTPHVSARDLKDRLDRGENVVVVDSRPVTEFKAFSIPGAVDLPGAELVYRFHEAVPDSETLVVVNCAGRTRSIIGAQALINAGVPNKVVSLANGTMDWLMQGYTLDKDAYNLPPRPTGAAFEKAKQSAEHLRRRFPISIIDRDELARFRHDHNAGKRSTYVIDVRTEEEYRDGHLPGSRWAAGGQLVQQVDRWVGTQNSRIVLVDSADLVRATITASWLVQINWAEVYILKSALTGPLELGAEPQLIAEALPEIDALTPVELSTLLADGAAVVIDLDTSAVYRAGHIPGAHFAIRERLAADAGKIPGGATIVVTSTDGRLAAFGANDLRVRTDRPVKILNGGTAAWSAAGLPLETGETALLHPAEDFLVQAYQLPEPERFPAFKRYLAWELGLVEQLDRDGTANYRVFPHLQNAALENAE
jgi:rhodanese-related sulfurtransferase